MLNYESCDALQAALNRRCQAHLSQGAHAIDRKQGCGTAEGEELMRVSRDFAAVMYTMVIKEMQKTVAADDEAQGIIGEGARGMIAMFLPQSLAQSPADPVANYVYRQLSGSDGGRLDEQA